MRYKINRTLSILSCCITLFYVCAQTPAHTFSEMEIKHVRVQTPNLFDSAQQIYLDLDSMNYAFCFPLSGAKLISDYGSSSGRSSHSGCDIKTFANDTIRAAFDGVVRMSKLYGAYGNVIVLRHANGLETVYSHNSKNFVLSGDSVYSGQAIALTGRTGRASTEHLHFETRINGEHFNPHLIFNFTKHGLNQGMVICKKSANGIKVCLDKACEKEQKKGAD